MLHSSFQGLENVQKRATKLKVKVLESESHEERLREPNLEKRRLREVLTALSNHLTGG